MNLNFKKVAIGRSRNDEGTVVEGLDKELLLYEGNGLRIPFEAYYPDDRAVIYRPPLAVPLPPGMSREDIYEEMIAGARAIISRKVVWG